MDFMSYGDIDPVEAWKEINWRVISHNHKDFETAISDKCPLCVIEAALYGGLR